LEKQLCKGPTQDMARGNVMGRYGSW